MQFEIRTKVEQNAQQVFEGFTEDLFLALKPPLMPLRLERYDGCYKGDEVHVILGASFFTQEWHALIVEQGETDHEIYFIDEGKKLPFFFKSWRHRHRILKDGNGAIIVDDIQYTSPFFLMDYLMYPAIYFQFWIRKPIYKKLFGIVES